MIRETVRAGYLVTLHVVMVPEALAVARVPNRVQAGGHGVPEDKIRTRCHRIWPLVAAAIDAVDTAVVYDNSKAHGPFRVAARFQRGVLIAKPHWPAWTPDPLRHMPDRRLADPN